MPNKREFESKFKQANELYAKERYGDALVILNELDACFPNTRNVMWPRAGCLYRMGKYDLAVPICNTLVAIYNDERAASMLEKMAKRGIHVSHEDATVAIYSPSPSMLTESDLLAPPPAAPQVLKPEEAEGPPWAKIGITDSPNCSCMRRIASPG